MAISAPRGRPAAVSTIRTRIIAEVGRLLSAVSARERARHRPRTSAEQAGRPAADRDDAQSAEILRRTVRRRRRYARYRCGGQASGTAERCSPTRIPEPRVPGHVIAVAIRLPDSMLSQGPL